MPVSIFNLLYQLRLIDDVAVPFEDYIMRFRFVVVDNIIYHDYSENSKWREKQYLETAKRRKSNTLALIPDVIVKNELVIKNRYGKRS